MFMVIVSYQRASHCSCAEILLEAFLNIDSSFDATRMSWMVAVLLVFVISTLLLAIADRWAADKEG